MFTIDKYVVAESLEQAYELNKNKRNKIIGGMLWLKMGRKKIGTAIDLSLLNLNNIEEDEEKFSIGCMCTLRDIETNDKLKKSFNSVITKAVENIVGVQMRNLSTVGGSIYSRFGFSDLLTVLLALDTYVELYKGGVIALEKYVDMPLDNDILTKIIIKKDNRKIIYSSQRNSATDFPILNCAVANKKNEWFLAHGARPMKAKLTKFTMNDNCTIDDFDSIIKEIVANTDFGTNIRGSKEYRQILATVLAKRNIEELLNGGSHAN